MSKYLNFKAGEKALQVIRDKGLSPDDVKIMAGASGAAKWLVLSDLDRFLFSKWFRVRKTPLFLAGTSIGAWRFAAAACPDPEDSLLKLEDSYINQTYIGKPTKKEITAFGWQIIDRIFDDRSVSHALNHPSFRLNIIASRSKPVVSSSSSILTGAGFGLSILANSVRRKYLGYFFERALFFDQRGLPPFYDMNCFPMKRICLSPQNLREAVMASSAIPFMTEPLKNIKGAPSGIYRDGGILDYNLDIPFLPEGSNDIVFYPHYSERITPGWFDKKLKHRRPLEKNMSNVLLAYPSAEFLKLLPHGRIPDRKDFMHFFGKDGERIRYWKKSAEIGRVITEEFNDAVESGRIRNMVRPFF
ncbi:patatin-like phospholipase family protein [Desulforegula conservatrix]|uniref:patatin-like phospholipase family protein n=1 Tax=Desulforegula conservatrix TaxID=153026 RepID=UPI000414B102|nr:patatin-like phospholipase family protein [Desulforegula conservatrix]